MQVVLLIWTKGRIGIPLGLRIWQKGGKSKLKLWTKLLSEALRRGVTPMYAFSDSWYAGEGLLNSVEQFGWKYITKAKKNRLFEKVRFLKRSRKLKKNG
jgi:hypothetical protein